MDVVVFELSAGEQLAVACASFVGDQVPGGF
jgi:hypothetical protein